MFSARNRGKFDCQTLVETIEINIRKIVKTESDVAFENIKMAHVGLNQNLGNALRLRPHAFRTQSFRNAKITILGDAMKRIEIFVVEPRQKFKIVHMTDCKPNGFGFVDR